MSDHPRIDPVPDRAVTADEGLLVAHERESGGGARPRPLTIGILVSLGALVLFSGAYLVRYAGSYSPMIYDENAKPVAAGLALKIDPVALGKKQFKTECVSCHRAQGEGVPSIYPPLAGSEWVVGSSSRVIRIVLYGLRGKVHVEGAEFGASTMPVYGRVENSAHNWSDQKIAAVLTYVRQEWGNKADPISEDEVAAVRKALGNRAPMTETELEQVK